MSLFTELVGLPHPSAINESTFSNFGPIDRSSLSYYEDDDYDYANSDELDVTLKNLLPKTIFHKGAEEYNLTEVVIGITLAVLANIIGGFAIVLKKLSLRQLNATGKKPASEGGFSYLKSKRWWLGLSILVVADIVGFVSLIFAPAIVVISLSVLTIVVAAIMSPIFLKEKLSKLARVACGLVMVGCLIVTLNGPKVQEISSMDELELYLLTPGFIAYIVIVVVLLGILMYLAPKYGSTHIMINALICAMAGSLSIMFTKGVGTGIKLTFESENAFIRWSLWACAVGLCVTLMIELVFTQRALDVYNLYVFIPVWYVFVSALVILLSTVLFSKSRTISGKDITLTLAGFLVNALALYIFSLDATQREEMEKAKKSVENESPALPCEDGSTNVYEIQQNTNTGSLSTAASKVSSMMMNPSANLNGMIIRDHGKTNSCFSLSSEAPSTSTISTKDSSSIDSNGDTNSQSCSSNKSTVNDSPTSSCSNHRQHGAGVAEECSGDINS